MYVLYVMYVRLVSAPLFALLTEARGLETEYNTEVPQKHSTF